MNKEFIFQLKRLFPEMMLKFFNYECEKGSSIENQIKGSMVNTMKEYKIDPENRWVKGTLGNYIYGNGDVSIEKVFDKYNEMHLAEMPGRGISFTPNGKRQTYHDETKATKLDLKKSNGVKGMYSIPIDIDKKDLDKVGVPLPDDFKQYKEWIKVPSLDFFKRWMKRMPTIKSDADNIDIYFTKFAQQIGLVNITPGGFHAYIVLPPEGVIEDMENERYHNFMVRLHALIGTYLYMDDSKTNISDVFRVPTSIHRKHRKEQGQDNPVCVPYMIKNLVYGPNYIDDNGIVHEVEDGMYLELGKPNELDLNDFKYTTQEYILAVEKGLENLYNDPEFMKKIVWYNNPDNIRNYKLSFSKDFNVITSAETEIRRCCSLHGLTRGKIFQNLPDNKIVLDSNGTSLKIFDPIKQTRQQTDGYKFKRCGIPPYDKDKLPRNNIARLIEMKGGMVANTCGGYVNDKFSMNGRPAGPMGAFVYSYFKEFISTGEMKSNIRKDVKDFFKRICPEMNVDLLSDFTPVEDIEKKVGTEDTYIVVGSKETRLKTQKYSNTGQELSMAGNGILLFKGKVEPYSKLLVKNKGMKVIYEEANNVKKDLIEEYNVFYRFKTKNYNEIMGQVEDRIVNIPKCITSKTLNEAFLKTRSKISFAGDDSTVKQMFECLDNATDQTYEKFDEYGIQSEIGFQGSGYKTNWRTDEIFCQIGNQQTLGPKQDHLFSIDETSNDIIRDDLEETTISKYFEQCKLLGKQSVYLKSFINAATTMLMNLATDIKDHGINISPNLSIYGLTQSGKTTLMKMIQAMFGFKPMKRYLSLDIVTPQPLAYAAMDSAPLFLDEVTAINNTEVRKMQDKESVLRSIANKDIRRKGGLSRNTEWPQRSPVLAFGETAFSNPSVANRFIQIKIKISDRSNNTEAKDFVEKHTIQKELCAYWIKRMNRLPELVELIKGYKEYLQKNVSGLEQRLYEMEAFGLLFSLENNIITREEYCKLLQENRESVFGLQGDMISVVNDIAALIVKNTSKKSMITYNKFIKFPDDTWNYPAQELNYIMIDVAASDESASLLDNAIESINIRQKGFCTMINKTTAIIVSYNDQMLKDFGCSKNFIDFNTLLRARIDAFTDSYYAKNRILEFKGTIESRTASYSQMKQLEKLFTSGQEG